MFETLSENFIGNIDSVKKEGAHYHIRGWVVPLITSDDCLISNEGFVSITPEERKDIFNHFKQSHINYLRCGFNVVLNPTSEETIIKVNGEDVFKVQVEIMESVLLPSPKFKLEISVVNNFYIDPNAVRKYALQQKFVTTDKHIAKNRTAKAFIPSWIRNSFQLCLGRPVKEFVGPSGVFQYTTAIDQIQHRFEQHEYTGVVCLTPDAAIKTGISTYKSRKTGLTAAATQSDAHARGISIEELNVRSLNNNYFDRTALEELDSIANVYNRLVIFNAKTFHSFTQNGGSDKETGNLFHTFFFNC